tara:strand:- start:618 stop:1013 length:396 start_codon:yes stop_codon:yes gene_type:complete
MSWVLANQNVASSNAASGISAAAGAAGNIMGAANAVQEAQGIQVSQAAQAVRGGASNVAAEGVSSELESRVAQLETSQAGSAGGGEVAGVAGFSQGDINAAQLAKIAGPKYGNAATDKPKNKTRGGWNAAF